ncbi:MAG: hypothetical protein M3015_07815 [Bacteroidota bacterium]|nr:hypothetical protein [Bacteroidota bacterium]
MKKIIYTLFFLSFLQNLFAQNIIDSGTYLLHKFEQNIGKEKYTVTKQGSFSFFNMK